MIKLTLALAAAAVLAGCAGSVEVVAPYHPSSNWRDQHVALTCPELAARRQEAVSEIDRYGKVVLAEAQPLVAIWKGQLEAVEVAQARNRCS